jgi:undecaprenyl diphosphate synthase
MTRIRHIAIIMDGNRRWAKQFGMSVAMGHAAGARRVKSIVKACASQGVRYLTLFAFSTENWQRPASEVSHLMKLLALYLNKEIKDMNSAGVRLKVVGDIAQFAPDIQALIHDGQANTAHNTKLTLTIAVNYGGRQDMVHAVKSWQADNPDVTVNAMTEDSLSAHFGMAHAPDPDLLIRTGGESRISNFMLWQMAYTELYFTHVLWPSFSPSDLQEAVTWFHTRERRFGGTQVEPSQVACNLLIDTKYDTQQNNF